MLTTALIHNKIVNARLRIAVSITVIEKAGGIGKILSRPGLWQEDDRRLTAEIYHKAKTMSGL
ncbi:MAG TPA: hypothetical protein DC049_15060 [Spirochaetia bacterium]|nr:hypothetical protein [Spirochaetia bacterium]